MGSSMTTTGAFVSSFPWLLQTFIARSYDDEDSSGKENDESSDDHLEPDPYNLRECGPETVLGVTLGEFVNTAQSVPHVPMKYLLTGIPSGSATYRHGILLEKNLVTEEQLHRLKCQRDFDSLIGHIKNPECHQLPYNRPLNVYPVPRPTDSMTEDNHMMAEIPVVSSSHTCLPSQNLKRFADGWGRNFPECPTV
jgi:hypothetical protein